MVVRLICPRENPVDDGAVGAAESRDGPLNAVSNTTDKVAVGGGGNDGQYDLDHARSFLREVGVNPQTVDNARWTELRGYVRGHMNL